jgi:hypothetical protein
VGCGGSCKWARSSSSSEQQQQPAAETAAAAAAAAAEAEAATDLQGESCSRVLAEMLCCKLMRLLFVMSAAVVLVLLPGSG